MAIDIVHTPHSQYLEVQIQGVRTPGKEFEEATAYWTKIFSISEQVNQKNILAHTRALGRIPVNAQINFSFKLKEIGCTPAHRIAVVTNDDELIKNVQLIYLYMQGEGFTVRIFKRKEKGRRWLLQEKKKFSIRDLLDSFD